VELEESTHLLMACLAPGDECRDDALDLLTGGDRSAPHRVRWAQWSDVWVLRDPADAAVGVGAAAALTVASGSADVVEIGPIWGAPGWRGHDVELCLAEELLDALRRRGVRRIVAGAGNVDLERIRLLTRAGFRMSHVERDGCTAERGWVARDASGPNRDLLWFDIDL
jgi:GNAT superfamily N-acetyltransferase